MINLNNNSKKKIIRQNINIKISNIKYVTHLISY